MGPNMTGEGHQSGEQRPRTEIAEFSERSVTLTRNYADRGLDEKQYGGNKSKVWSSLYHW